MKLKLTFKNTGETDALPRRAEVYVQNKAKQSKAKQSKAKLSKAKQCRDEQKARFSLATTQVARSHMGHQLANATNTCGLQL